MLDDDVEHLGAIVILLRLLLVDGVCASYLVQQHLVATVAGGFEAVPHQIGEPDVHHRQFELDVTEVTRTIVVLVSTGVTTNAGLDDTHLRVHQSLMIGVSVVLVGVCRLDLDCAHAAYLVR